MKIKIKSRLGAVLFAAVIANDTAPTLQVREAVKAAVAAKADLSGADLSGAYLSGADLSGAYLSGADLRRADLSGADLRRAYLSGAYLRGADLSGADLSGADLRRAYLSGADLSGADLSGTKERPELVIASLGGRASRSDGYEFLIFNMEKGAAIIRAGCQTRTIAGYRQHVASDYPDTPKAKETLRILAFLAAQAKADPW
jgi:hypothetical protein